MTTFIYKRWQRSNILYLWKSEKKRCHFTAIFLHTLAQPGRDLNPCTRSRSTMALPVSLKEDTPVLFVYCVLYLFVIRQQQQTNKTNKNSYDNNFKLLDAAIHISSIIRCIIYSFGSIFWQCSLPCKETNWPETKQAWKRSHHRRTHAIQTPR